MPRMGRRKQRDKHLPPRMRCKHGAYYYVHNPDPVTGKRRWQRLSADLREAKLKWAQIEGDEVDSQPGTISAAVEHYRAHYMGTLSREWQLERERHFKRLLGVFSADTPVAEIEPPDVKRYYVEHPRKPTARKELSTLSVVLNRGIEDGVLPHVANPCSSVTIPKDAPRDRYVTDQEFLAVKALADPHWQAIMDFAYFSAWRRGDILNLTVDQLEQEGIRMRQRKSGQKQLLAWTPTLRDVVGRLQSTRAVRGFYLVRQRDGRPYSVDGFKAIWQRLVKRALDKGFITERYTFHDLRAKAGTDAESQGYDPQRLLGHASPKQTETYLRAKRVWKVSPLEPRQNDGTAEDA